MWVFIWNSLSIITKQNDSKCTQLWVQAIAAKISFAHITHCLASKSTNVPDNDLRLSRHISIYNVRSYKGDSQFTGKYTPTPQKYMLLCKRILVASIIPLVPSTNIYLMYTYIKHYVWHWGNSGKSTYFPNFWCLECICVYIYKYIKYKWAKIRGELRNKVGGIILLWKSWKWYLNWDLKDKELNRCGRTWRDCFLKQEECRKMPRRQKKQHEKNSI